MILKKIAVLFIVENNEMNNKTAEIHYNYVTSTMDYIRKKTKIVSPCLISNVNPDFLSSEYLGIKFVTLSQPSNQFLIIHRGGTRFKFYYTFGGKYVVCTSVQQYDNDLIDIVEKICDMLYEHENCECCTLKMCELCDYKTLFKTPEQEDDIE